MSDPTTLLLLTCATCTDPPTPPERVEEPTSIQQPDQRFLSLQAPSFKSISSPEMGSPETGSPKIRSSARLPASLTGTQAAPLLSVTPEVVPASPADKSLIEWTAAPASPPIETAAPSTLTSILRFGSRGDQVRQLQQHLQQGGYYSGRLDGIYGHQTQDAVRAFQQAQHLQADGIVGSVTWERLQQPTELEGAPSAAKQPHSVSELPSQSPAPALTSTRPLAEPGLEQISSGSAPQPSASPAQTIRPRGVAPPAAVEPSLARRSDTNQKTALVFFEASPEYLWLVAWAVVYIGGWVVLLRTHRQDLTGFHFTQSVRKQASEQATTDNSLADSNQDGTVAVDGTIGISQAAISSEAGIAPFIFQTPVSPELTDVIPILEAEPISLVESDTSESAASKPNPVESVPSESELALVSESMEASLPITWADEGVVEALDGLFAELGSFAREEEEVAEGEEGGDRSDNSSRTNPWVDPETASTIIGVLPPNSPETGEPYTYELVNNAGGAFILDGYDLRITDDALLAIQGDISYIVTVRRTDAHGEQADKSFVVSLSKAEAEELRHGGEELAHSA